MKVRVRVRVRVRLGLRSSRCHRVSSTSPAAIVSIAVVSTAMASIVKASSQGKYSQGKYSQGEYSHGECSHGEYACLLAHPAQLRLTRGLGHHSHLVGTAHKSKHKSNALLTVLLSIRSACVPAW